MPMLADPSAKYTPYTPLALPDRQWPRARIRAAPVWLSTDLRDGNQALARPMAGAQKRVLFRHLVRCGFTEIEVAFPAASETEFAFVRALVADGEIPDDVWIQVLTPARAELVQRTFDAIAGARKVIIHLFNAAAPCFRAVVFRKTQAETTALATAHTALIRGLAEQHTARHGTRFRFAYGVEAFSQTEPAYAVELCSAVKRAWGAAGSAFEERIIFNLPATVEVAPPNHYADLIEYFCRHMEGRDEMLVSLHTHNDRGTAVAATELGLLAGADRVEGCLFGHGERSGNVDLVTLALNLRAQGVPCGLALGDADEDLRATAALVVACTALPVDMRHPYASALRDNSTRVVKGREQERGARDSELEAQQRTLARYDSDTATPTPSGVPDPPPAPADIARTSTYTDTHASAAGCASSSLNTTAPCVLLAEGLEPSGEGMHMGRTDDTHTTHMHGGLPAYGSPTCGVGVDADAFPPPSLVQAASTLSATNRPLTALCADAHEAPHTLNINIGSDGSESLPIPKGAPLSSSMGGPARLVDVDVDADEIRTGTGTGTGAGSVWAVGQDADVRFPLRSRAEPLDCHARG